MKARSGRIDVECVARKQWWKLVSRVVSSEIRSKFLEAWGERVLLAVPLPHTSSPSTLHLRDSTQP